MVSFYQKFLKAFKE